MVRRLDEEKTVLVFPPELIKSIDDIANILQYLVDGGILPEGEYLLNEITSTLEEAYRRQKSKLKR